MVVDDAETAPPLPGISVETIHSNMFSRPTSRRPTSRTVSTSQGGYGPGAKTYTPGSRPARPLRQYSHGSDLSVPTVATPRSTTPTHGLGAVAATLEECNLDSSDNEDGNTKEFPGPNDPARVRILYRAACKKMGVTPSNKFLRSIPTGEVNIAHQGVGPYGARALAISLVTSMTVSELHLQGNALGCEGMKHISDMVQSNGVLKILDVSDNQLGTCGAEYLAKMVEDSDALSKLKASNNQFDENAAVFLSAALKKNTTIRILDLSANEFQERGGVLLGKALGDNEVLEYVNLSWNHLRNSGICGIAECIKENISIKTLDISMNGIGRDGAEAIGQALKHNRSLRTLKMRASRINVDGLLLFFTRMTGNETLKSVDLAENPVTNEDVIIAMRSLLFNPSLAIVDIGFENVSVSKEFFEIRDQIRELRPNFNATYGNILRVKSIPKRFQEEIMTPRVGDPLEMLMAFLKQNNLRMMDLFVRLDTDKSCAISHDEFRIGIKNAGIELNEHQMDNLIETLDKDGDGEIDFGELVDAYRNYQRKLLRKSGQDSRAGSRPSSRPTSPPGSSVMPGYSDDGAQVHTRPKSRNNSRPTSPFAVDMSRPLGNPNELILDSEYLKAGTGMHRPSIHDVHFHVPVLKSSALHSAILEAKMVMREEEED